MGNRVVVDLDFSQSKCHKSLMDFLFKRKLKLALFLISVKHVTAGYILGSTQIL